jgi:hypothetical protein
MPPRAPCSTVIVITTTLAPTIVAAATPVALRCLDAMGLSGAADVTVSCSGLPSARRRAYVCLGLAAPVEDLRCLDGRFLPPEWARTLTCPPARAAQAPAVRVTVLCLRSTGVSWSAIAPVSRRLPATRRTDRGRRTAARDLPRLLGTNPPVAASAPRTRPVPVPRHKLPRRTCLVIWASYAAFESVTFWCNRMTPFEMASAIHVPPTVERAPRLPRPPGAIDAGPGTVTRATAVPDWQPDGLVDIGPLQSGLGHS